MKVFFQRGTTKVRAEEARRSETRVEVQRGRCSEWVRRERVLTHLRVVFLVLLEDLND